MERCNYCDICSKRNDDSCPHQPHGVADMGHLIPSCFNVMDDEPSKIRFNQLRGISN